MSILGTFITGTVFGFVIAVFVLSICKVSSDYDRYENGFNDGYRSAQEDMNGKNRESDDSELWYRR